VNKASGGGEAMQLGGIGLTPDEEAKVRAAATEPADEETLVAWGHQLRADMTVLELVLAGHVKARVNEDGEISFSITDSGAKYVEEKLLPGGGLTVEVTEQ